MASLRSLGVLVLAALLPTCASAPDRGPARPHIVVIVADDLGFMDIRANNPFALYETPNLDRLAASGVRFTDGYASCPVCSPTRYSLMTGKYPTRAAATNYFSGRRAATYRPATFHDVMPLAEVTVAEVLREHGYATFFAGKWHLGPTEEFWPEAQGFDRNRGGHQRGGPYGGKRYFSPYGNPRLEDGPDGEHLPDRLAREACAFLAEQHAAGRPALTWLSFYSVHTPLMGRPDLVAKYAARVSELREDGADEFAPEEQVLPNGKPRRVRVLQRHAVYAAMVEAMDEAVGKVLDQLDSLGIADETIVVFTSDNGGLSTSEGMPTSNLPLRGGKGWLYEGGIREPWLVRAPGVLPGSICDVPISSIDLLPTLLQFAGLPVAEHGIDGRSFVDVVRPGGVVGARAQLANRPLFWHYPHYGNQGGFPGSAIRLGRHKLIQRLEDGRVHLYDLAADPGERNDLAEQHPERVTAMRQQLFEFYVEQDARFLRPRKDKTPWQPDLDGLR